MASRKLVWRPIALALLFAVSACGSAPQTTLHSSVGPAPVVLTDTSPGQLAIFISITMGGYDSTTRDTASVHVGFLSDGRPVKFVEDEAVICEGTALRRFVGSFEGSFTSSAIEGKTMRCQYAQARQSAPFAFAVPAALLLLSPHDHETVAASRQTQVTFRSAPGALPWVVALAPQSKAYARPGDTTSTDARLDTSALHGTGSLSITQQLDLTDIQAAQFRSRAGRIQSMTMIAVTWV